MPQASFSLTCWQTTPSSRYCRYQVHYYQLSFSPAYRPNCLFERPPRSTKTSRIFPCARSQSTLVLSRMQVSRWQMW